MYLPVTKVFLQTHACSTSYLNKIIWWSVSLSYFGACGFDSHLADQLFIETGLL
jgi:hypothetical protein